ncbi:hypothetical protein, partial [Pseudomonas syringae group genomosp. 7]|uniref:hypothetical protein n=1 Tax=Pseudomonas syringae group genomosp. 7 TaxID=251699 RepID=UPI00376FC2DB
MHAAGLPADSVMEVSFYFFGLIFLGSPADAGTVIRTHMIQKSKNTVSPSPGTRMSNRLAV